jgi:hypothetical protein
MDKIFGSDRNVQKEDPIRNELFNILDYYNAPCELYDFYKLMKPEEAISCCEYKFHMIKDTVENYGSMENPKKSFDICYAYMGMGHVCALVYDPKVTRYYFRHDGGSNGWEREEINNFFEIVFNPRDSKYAKRMFTFEQAIEHVSKGCGHEYMISEHE